MNIIVTVLAVIVGCFGGITALRMLAEGISVMPFGLGDCRCCRADCRCNYGKENEASCRENFVGSVVICVAAFILDSSGAAIELFDETIKGEELYGGLAVWGALSAGFAMYAEKKAAKKSAEVNVNKG